MLTLTAHARQRMVQRNVSRSEVSSILGWGFITHCAGTVQIHLRRKDVPMYLQSNDRLMRLVGVTLVLDRDESTLITLWRNRKNGLRHIRRKPRYGLTIK